MLNLLRHLKLTCRGPATEMWQTGIVHARAENLLTQAQLENARITWLPTPQTFHFVADPFGIEHDGYFTVFVEAFDYRVKRGEIHYYQYDQQWQLTGHGVALRRKKHLSYPSILRDGDAIYMLPEENKSGKLTLYRAKNFPSEWEPVATLLDLPAIDASVVKHDGKWWMFYALPGDNGEAMRQLHVAYADALTGPWTEHAANPVRDALDSARPAGLPFVHENALYLPTQDGTVSYGGAVNFLRIDTLTPDQFAATVVSRLTPSAHINANYLDGLHTFAQAGEVTMIDVKHLSYCQKRRLINWERRIRRVLKLPPKRPVSMQKFAAQP